MDTLENKKPVVESEKSVAYVAPVVPKKPDNHIIVDGAVENLFDDAQYIEGPFDDLKVGQGVFIPNEQNKTNEVLLNETHTVVRRLREQYSEIETDENGNELLEVLTAQTKKRNPDGTIRMEGDKPIVGADFLHRSKRIYYRNFVVKSVIKDANLSKSVKAPEDGIFVIRVL